MDGRGGMYFTYCFLLDEAVVSEIFLIIDATESKNMSKFAVQNGVPWDQQARTSGIPWIDSGRSAGSAWYWTRRCDCCYEHWMKLPEYPLTTPPVVSRPLLLAVRCLFQRWLPLTVFVCFALDSHGRRKKGVL